LLRISFYILQQESLQESIVRACIVCVRVCAIISTMRLLIDADVIGCSGNEGTYQPRSLIGCDFYRVT